MPSRIRYFILLLTTKASIATKNNIFDYMKPFESLNYNQKQATFQNHPEGEKNPLLVSKLSAPNLLDLLSELQNSESKQTSAHLPEFRLHKKTVSFNPELESKYVVYQKLTEILNKRQPSYFDTEMNNSYPNEILYNYLKSELSSLCCNKHTIEERNEEHKTQTNPSFHVKPLDLNIFLVFNEEIKGVTEDNLVIVDPDSLSSNATIFPLGAIPKYLNNSDLKVLMIKISQELNKIENLPMLSKLANGKIEGPKASILKYINHPQTRRYIKPHRCNYQAPLSKVFGGTRWLICSGYININIPSIYDR